MFSFHDNISLKHSFQQFLDLVGDTTFIDVARCTDPACTDQPWESLDFVCREFDIPRIIQIWTKGPRAALQRGRKILEQCRRHGTIIICQLTVTGFGPEVEPRVPWPVDWQGIDQMISFLGTPQALLWRYDPVIPGISDMDTLETLAEKFAELGISRAVYNWGEYGWELVRKRMGKFYDRIDFGLDKNVVSRKIEHIGQSHGIDFLILAEGEKLSGDLNLSSRGCWQYEWLTEVCEDFPSRNLLPAVYRAGCMCAPSFDIGIEGQFNRCHGCVYCFAH
jgi:hypothetical protein